MSFIFVPGAGSGSGPVIKNAAGTTLTPAWTLRGNAATAGFVTGFAQLDAAGNFVGTWIPRTGALAALQALAGTLGEIGSATNTPALVEFNGVAGQATTFYPYASTASVVVAGAGAVATVLPTGVDYVRLTLGAGITSYTGTLTAGVIDGQVVEVQLISTQAGMIAYTVSGAVLAGAGTPTLSASIPGANRPISARFQWSATAAAWSLIDQVTTPKPGTDTPTSLNVGINNNVSGLDALAIGYSIAITNAANATAAGANVVIKALNGTGVGTNATVTGDSGTALGSGASVSGARGFAVNQGSASADLAVALGPLTGVLGNGACGISTSGNTTIYGPSSFVLGGGNGNFFNFVYGFGSTALGGAGTGNQAQAFSYTATGGVFPGAVTFTMASVGTAPNNLEIGQEVVVQSNVFGYYMTGVISNVVGLVVTVAFTTGNTSVPPTGFPAVGTLAECMQGQQSTGIGGGAAPRNYGAVANAPFSIATVGDAQLEAIVLGIQTVGAAAGVMTTTGTAVNANKAFGNSNRFILEPGKGYAIELTLTAKQSGSANFARFTRQMACVNQAGVVTIAQAPLLIGADLTFGALTFVGNVAVAVNAAFQAVDFTVTGLAGLTINWVAELRCVGNAA